jgi:hypothetical protein
MKINKNKSLVMKTAALSSLFLALGPVYAATVQNGYTTESGRIVNMQNGKKNIITMHGVNWFGFNTATYAPHGLWGGQSGNYVTSQYNTDLRTMIDRIKGLGFNAVRLPFLFDFVLNPAGKSPNMQQNANCPYSPNRGEESKPNPNPALNGKGCNVDFKTSGYEQNAWGFFKYTIDQFTNNGVYVLLDNHYEETLFPNEANREQWLQGWQIIANEFKNNPYVIGYDLFNEPDSKGLQWPTWGASAVAATKLIYSISPNKLIFIEGTGQGSFGANWGTGFKTTGMGYSDARNPMQYLFDPLFKANQVTPGILQQIVISPHVYGMDGTNGQGSPSLYDKISNYDDIFGYINKKGVCTTITGPAQCQVFPLAIGEFGATFNFSTYKSPFSADGDVRVMNIIGAYMKNANVTANTNDPDVQAGKKYLVAQDALGFTANHNPIYDYFYWSWNPNSGNTGGILGGVDSSNHLNQSNWTDVIWTKVNYLSLFLGLPANGQSGGGGTTPPEQGELCVVVNQDQTKAPGLTASNFAPISIQGSGSQFTLRPTTFGVPVCDTVNPGTYTINGSTLYGTTNQYDSTDQTAQVKSAEKTTNTISYEASPIKNTDIRVNGLQTNQLSTVTLTSTTQTSQVYTISFSSTSSAKLVHIKPGTYKVTASNINGMTSQVSPSLVTIKEGQFKVSVLVSYVPTQSQGNATCAIQFKQQGGAPNQWYPNAQYTFAAQVANVGTTNATSNWSLNFKFGADVLGLSNYWNMATPALMNKIPGSSQPYAFDVVPVASWQVLGSANPITFDQIGYIEKLNWKTNFQTGVNAIPANVSLTFNGKVINCTIGLVTK